MRPYGPGEAREWALEHLRGVTGCLLPTFTSDLNRINEHAIRFDVARERELGMSGVLVTAECGTTMEELKQVTAIAVDAAGDELHVFAHAALSTLEENVELARYSQEVGAQGVLVPYPLTFYPVTEDDVLEYTRRLGKASDLGMVVFAMHLWNFRRLHPSDFSPDLIGRMIDEIPSVMAIKTELGLPGLAGIGQIFERYRDRVVVADPLEQNAPLWTRAYGMPWMGTSNYEALGPEVPRYFSLLQEGRYEEAMTIYWRTHPARRASAELVQEAMAGTSLVPRLLWKYQGWLNGFNGGPIRSPQQRLSDGQMETLRAAASASGLDVTSDPDRDFFVGRHPA